MIDVPTYRGSDPFTFVSYAHEDSEVVIEEIRQLQSDGLNIWYDEGISPGTVWREELANAIAGCEKFLFFLSQKSITSENCLQEISFALDEKKSVLVVHLSKTELPPALRLSLMDRQAILKYELSIDDYQQKLRDSLSGSVPTPQDKINTPAKTKPPVQTIAISVVISIVIFIAISIAIGAGIFSNDRQDDQANSSDPSQVDAETLESSKPLLPNGIAVLPLANMSPDPDDAFFAAGMCTMKS